MTGEMWVSLKVEQGVGIVRLERPAALNALNASFGRQFRDAVFAAIDQGARAIVVAGSARAFSVGADRNALASSDGEQDSVTPSGWLCLRELEVPSVAAVSGHAIGGGFELALMCDLIIASPNARFSLPEVRLGIIPGMGGIQYVARAAGVAIARDLILTGRILTATEAEQAGIVARVTENVIDEATDMAKTMALLPEAALASTRRALDLVSEPLTEALRAENKLLRTLLKAHAGSNAARP